jgi:hypothetical protein
MGLKINQFGICRSYIIRLCNSGKVCEIYRKIITNNVKYIRCKVVIKCDTGSRSWITEGSSLDDEVRSVRV